MVEVQFDLQRAILEDLGVSRASDLIHLVGSYAGEGDIGPSIGEVEPGLQGVLISSEN